MLAHLAGRRHLDAVACRARAADHAADHAACRERQVAGADLGADGADAGADAGFDECPDASPDAGYAAGSNGDAGERAARSETSTAGGACRGTRHPDHDAAFKAWNEHSVAPIEASGYFVEPPDAALSLLSAALEGPASTVEARAFD
jgi:hypothetical protein